MMIDDLLSRYDAARAEGRQLTPEELCRDTPELLETVRYHMRALNAVTGLPQMKAVPCTQAEIETRIRVLALHGKGGLGEVYRATDEALGREVALKVVARRHDARFEREAAITGQLEHPGIVPVHGRGVTDGGLPCYVMRFVAGPTLAEAIEAFHAGQPVLTRANPQFRALLARFISVCQTVAFAHSRGIIHRDLKPANVLCGDYGETLVIDWGLAKETGVRDQGSGIREEKAPELTQDGGIIGTPAYMSPEQKRGEAATTASDLYALGGILHVLLARSASESDQNSLALRANKTLQRIALKALSESPADRYATALDLAAEVERWLADEPVRAAPDPFSARARRWMRNHRVLVGTTAAALVVATVSLAIAALVLGSKNRELRSAIALADEREREAVANFQMACDAVDQFSFNAPTDARQRDHDLERLRAQLLKSAGAFYQKRAAGSSRLAAVQAHTRLGRIALQTNDRAAAEAEFRQAVEQAKASPATAEMQSLESEAWAGLAEAYGKALKFDDAAAACRTSRDLKRASFGGTPRSAEDRAALAALELRIGETLARGSGDNPEAEAAFRAAIHLTNANRGDAVRLWKDAVPAHIGLGTMKVKGGERAVGELIWTEVRKWAAAESAPTTDPDRQGVQTQLAVFCYGTGNDYRERERYADAEPFLLQARELYVALAASNPGIASYHVGACDAQSALALLRRSQNKVDESRRLFLANLDAMTALHRSSLDERDYRSRLVHLRCRLADLEMGVKDWLKAREHLASTEAVLRPVLADVLIRKEVIAGWTRYLAAVGNVPEHLVPMWDHLLTHIRDLSEPESATEAVAMLAFMEQVGGFKYPQNLARLRGREFESLRKRADFQALLAKVDVKSP